MMMFYRRRASPKHRYDMTEVEYGGRGHRTRLRNDHKDHVLVIGVAALLLFVIFPWIEPHLPINQVTVQNK